MRARVRAHTPTPTPTPTPIPTPTHARTHRLGVELDNQGLETPDPATSRLTDTASFVTNVVFTIEVMTSG